MSGLGIAGMMPLIGQLYNRVVGLGSPGPNGVDLICNNIICWSDLVSKHFMSVALDIMSISCNIHLCGLPSATYHHSGNNICHFDQHRGYNIYLCGLPSASVS